MDHSTFCVFITSCFTWKAVGGHQVRHGGGETEAGTNRDAILQLSQCYFLGWDRKIQPFPRNSEGYRWSWFYTFVPSLCLKSFVWSVPFLALQITPFWDVHFKEFNLKVLVHLGHVTAVVSTCHHAKESIDWPLHATVLDILAKVNENLYSMKTITGKMAYAGHLIRDFILPSFFFFFFHLSSARNMSARDKIKWRKAVT